MKRQRRLLCISLDAKKDRVVQFLLLTVVATADLYARSTVHPLQEMMRAALGLSDNQISVLQGAAMAVAPAAAAVPLGLLVDRYSRVRLLLLFALLNLASTFLTAFAPDFNALLFARGLIGLAHTAGCIAIFSLLADLYEPMQRGRASTVILIGQFGGIAIAFALGGMLATVFQSRPGGWRGAMSYLAWPLVAAAGAILFMREPPRVDVPAAKTSVGRAIQELWCYRRTVAPVIIGLVMAEVIMCASLVWAAPAFSRRFGLSSAHIGSIMSLVVLLSSVVGSVAGGFLADLCQRSRGPHRTISALAVLALASSPASLFPLVSNLNAATGLLFVCLTVINAIIVMAMSLITIVVPGEILGLCLSLSVGANTLFSVALAPLGVSALAGAIGGGKMIGDALAAVCVAAGFVSAILFTVGTRHMALRTRSVAAN